MPIPCVDTHVHFFDLRDPELRYAWLDPGGDPGETEVLGEYGAVRSERYWADDFHAETRFQEIAGVVHVQAALGTEDPVQETRWLQAFNDRLGIPNAAVGYVDLAAPDAEEQIDRHREFPIFSGIRDLRYDDYLTNPEWERGFAAVAERGLVCCDDPALEQVGDAAALAARHPGVTLCLDHALAPRQRDREYFGHWRKQLATLAAVPNTVIKISGLGMWDHAWTIDSLRPWVLACIEQFGTERAFFGSNWPVDRLYSTYGDLWSAYAEIVAEFSVAEQGALLGENAKRVFGLG